MTEKTSQENRVQVSRIKVSTDTCILQWVDEKGTPKRAMFPAKMANFPTLPPDVLAKGVPLDDRLGKLLDLSGIKAADTERALKEEGIYTYEDVQSNPVGVQKAFARLFGPAITSFFQSANQLRKGQQEKPQ